MDKIINIFIIIGIELNLCYMLFRRRMKKIPTLFKRIFKNHKIVDIIPEVYPGMEWVLEGQGEATVKYDGSCCAILNGELYKRYDAKKGKAIPDGAILCQDREDSFSAHMPCWVRCDRGNPSDKWFWYAYDNTTDIIDNHTYEAIGIHFQGNPYNLEKDILIPHGKDKVELDRSFYGIKRYLELNNIEGLVFWLDGEARCKIKREDFGITWNKK